MIFKKTLYFVSFFTFAAGVAVADASKDSTLHTEKALQPVSISSNGRYFVVENDDKPFFWLGDTAWLLFRNLNQEEAEHYLQNRAEKGFNVVQVMGIHNLGDSKNAYDMAATEVDGDLSSLLQTPGNDPSIPGEYDYWDHVEFIVDLAQKKGLYVAIVPIWGSNIAAHNVTEEQAENYGKWIAERFLKYPNIIWLNGGDIDAAKALEVWQALASGIRSVDHQHLMTFHPRGRRMSSEWFHEETWLDFNMFQSGHRTYAQDDTELNFGEDNWRYVQHDWNLSPIKPTLDGEPSYEHIPEGLHDIHGPLWYADDVRRYAYWSVFAGAAGFTYGNNSIMQFYELSDERGAYGAAVDWKDELDAAGAWQMRFLKRLITSYPMLERRPAQELIVQNKTRDRYAYQIATRGEHYGLVYTFMGDEIEVQPEILPGDSLDAWWFNPRTGGKTIIGSFDNHKPNSFDPPGSPYEGNDWVLILQSSSETESNTE